MSYFFTSFVFACGGFSARLQFAVQVLHAEYGLHLRRKYLNIAEGIEFEFRRDAVAHHLYDAFNDGVRVVGFDEVEVAVATGRGGLRFFAVVDRVCGRTIQLLSACR